MDANFLNLIDQVDDIRLKLENLVESIAATRISAHQERERTDSEEEDHKELHRPAQPSGFNTPRAIAKEFAEFAGWDPTEHKSRTDVTNVLCKYIKEHNLQNPNRPRQIVPDDKLSRVLKYDSEVDAPLTFSTMQKHISQLFA